jgi:hypothetical protein
MIKGPVFNEVQGLFFGYTVSPPPLFNCPLKPIFPHFSFEPSALSFELSAFSLESSAFCFKVMNYRITDACPRLPPEPYSATKIVVETD